MSRSRGATFTIKNQHGTVSGKLTVTLKLLSANATTLVLSALGSGSITSGTGKYAGAVGKLPHVEGKTTSTTVCPTPLTCSYSEAWKLTLHGQVTY